ncbi:transcriptional regulator [Aureimonas ureilytica]|uniref:Transcriptional regulator n=1 Tax=Aureimonas ureilytica TaxID=401562 RepID=A0A175RDG5_9HYPH|nr:LacI family DNA-binding transcriptional regulator [Aureimonas ureilytica]KTQ97139.1 transcriptional regulator [Aureimonas ureilytica]
MTDAASAPTGQRENLPLPSYDEVVRVRSAAKPAPDKARTALIARPPRIEDVAREAGVSPITVSRALRSPGLVSPATLERVRIVVEKTGYVSNPHASALRSGRSSVVAAFVSNLVSQQYHEAADACGEVLEAAGYQLMIGQTSYSYARETAAVHSLRALKPAAVFFTGVVELEDNRNFLRDLGVPVVESWAFPRDPIDMLVGISNTDGGRMAAEHLVSRGRRRLAFVGRSGGRGRLRLKGFEARASELGAEIVVIREVEHVRSMSEGHVVLRELVASDTKADAVFFANDLLAIGALLEARRLGLTVPDDLAILGMGDSEFAAQMTPSLSTIAIDGAAIGRRAGELLADRLLERSAQAVSEHVPLRLVARDSS